MEESAERDDSVLENEQNRPALATLLNNLPGMAYRCRHDERRTMLFVSQGSVELTGYAPSDLIEGRAVTYDSLIHPEDQADVFKEIEAAVEAQRPYRCVYRLNAADGQERWVLEKGEAVYAGDGRVEALEGIVTDHTERTTAYRLLERRVSDRTRKLSALYDILEVAADPGDLQSTISRTLERVLKAIRGDVGAIHLLDESGTVLRLVAQQGMVDAITTKITEIPIEHSQLTGWIVRHNQSLFIPQMSQDSRAADLASDKSLDVFIGVPIVARDQVQGVLTVLSEDISRFTAAEELELLDSVGEQIGVVVENARLRLKAEQLILLEERNRLARELHDSVTQSLYSVTLFAEAGRNLARSGEFERASDLFKDVLETGQQALKEMRLLVHKLRPSVLAEEGLQRALRHRLSAVEGRAGVKNQLVVEGSLEITADLEEALYHIAQEALNNAIKHAFASEVTIFLRQDERGLVELRVVDDGKGFDPETAAIGGGLGLTSMRERATEIGGKLLLNSKPGQGTTVKISVPLAGKSGQ